jgi:hypothetical protein
MGWWEIRDESGKIDFGASTHKMLNKIPGKDSPDNLYNGDEPADEMGRALNRISEMYVKTWGRKPRKAELKACFNFVTGAFTGR